MELSQANCGIGKTSFWKRGFNKYQEIQDPFWVQFIATALFVLLISVAMHDVSKALIFVASMYLHECGHGIVFLLNNIEIKIRILFPLGAICKPKNEEENKRSDLLHWNKVAWLMQSGPATNMILMVIGSLLALADINPSLNNIGRNLREVKAILAVFNLVPVSKLDAGQLFHLIFSSLDETKDRVVSVWVTVGSLCVMLFIAFATPIANNWWILLGNLVRGAGWIVFLVAFMAGIWHAQGRDNPSHSQSQQAMNNGQVAMHILIYTGMVFLTLYLI